MVEIFTAKTVQEAKDLAVSRFGAAMSEIQFEVLEEPKRGLFGRIKGEAKVKAEYEPLMRQTPIKAPKPVQPAAAAAPVATPPAPKAEAAPVPPAPKAEEAPAPATAPATQEAAPAAEAATPNVDADEKIAHAKDYISGILRQMDMPDDCTVTRTENGAVLSFDGDGSGAIIGRRGETLDALQYLASMISNRGDHDYFRISLDSCGYREKRRKTLEELAAKISKSVIRTGRSTTLEPMNPYERRIIHSAVSAIEGVSSRSIGDEPYRKVIISSTTAKHPEQTSRRADAPRRGQNGRPNRSDAPRRDDRERRPKNYEGPKKLDLQTSFEKDYKRPKPEDNVNAGLYGKIEF